MEQPEKALMFFKLAVEYYPNSANVYDALVDFYIAKDDTVNALKNANKAFELSGNEYHKSRLESLKQKN